MALDGNTALLLCVLLGSVSVSWLVGGGEWSEVYYYIPLDSDFLCYISPENEDATFYEI